MMLHEYFSNSLGEVKNMASMWEFLRNQLVARNIVRAKIPLLMDDIFWMIGNGGAFTTRTVNEQLEELGWGPEVLDETIFQLIVYILKSEWGYRVRHYMVED